MVLVTVETLVLDPLVALTELDDDTEEGEEEEEEEGVGEKGA